MSLIASHPSEEQTLLIESASRFLKAQEAALLTEVSPSSERPLTNLWKEIAMMGWTRLMASEQGAGLGMSTLDAALICEQAGRYLLPLPLSQAMATAALIDEANAPPHPDTAPASIAIQQWLDGTLLLGLARKHRNDNTLWVEYAYANGALVIQDTPDGFQCVLNTTGMTGQGLDPAICTGTTVPGTARECATLPCSNAARHRYTLRTRLLRCAELLGTGHAALDAAVRYAGEREQFGKPIGGQQAIKHRLAENWMALDDAGLLLGHACEKTDSATNTESIHEAEQMTAMAELAATEAALATTRQAVQTFGAMGITWECPVHRYLKRAKHHQLVLSNERTSHNLLEALWQAA